MAEILLSVVGSAVIAGGIEIFAVLFGHDLNYFIVWLVVFLAWWGVILIDGDLDF
jgi:hypothetical protein